MTPELAALTAAVSDLYERSFQLSHRKLSEIVADRDDLPATLSHEAIRQILRGKPTKLPNLITLATVLAEQAGLSVESQVARIRELWGATRRPAASALAPEPAALRQATRGLYGRTDPVSLFLAATVFAPQTRDGRFLIAPTSTSGAWMCAFTAEDRLRAHRPKTAEPWDGGFVALSGRELVRRVCALPIGVGILVDPALGDDMAETLPLPHHLLVELDLVAE
ncbi:hypothetical protein [Actinokineospora sp. HUAS TT18]|uniref:hypothetical protein n=1 Tax=Actinokineospora sp. HUAS TT18 TaxID=3447451 RepID=UPI003F523063